MYANVVDISNDAVDKVFDYVALNNTEVGMRVKVPFGARSLLGYVIGLSNTSSFSPEKIKPIISNLEETPKLKKEILSLVNFMADKFFLRVSDCIKLALPTCIRLDTEREQNNFSLSLLIDFDTAINIINTKRYCFKICKPKIPCTRIRKNQNRNLYLNKTTTKCS